MRKSGRIITIGSFDGVHRGHQALLALTRREAKKRRLKAMALTFKIPPKMVLSSLALSLLSDPLEKAYLLRRHGMDDVQILTFDKKLSTTKPFHFLRDILIKRFNAKGVVVGSDFRFGAGRSAGALELVRWGQELGIPIWVVAPVKWKRKTVSSSLIRQFLETGRYTQAEGFLGHPYTVSGKVVRGQGLGRKLGFPTANLKIETGKAVPRGVYAATAWVLGRGKPRFYKGACNIGTRPTIKGQHVLSVEVHFFGKPGNLTGRVVLMELVSRLRSEKKFKNVEMLTRTVRKDIANAKFCLRKVSQPNLYSFKRNSV